MAPKIGIRTFLYTMALLCVPVKHANALILTDNMRFSAQGQSMWSSGAESEWSEGEVLGVSWGLDSPETLNVGASVSGFSLEAGISSRGIVGVFAEATASAGGLDIHLPVNASLTLPDTITQNTWFEIATSGGMSSESSITALAPSFNAQLYSMINVENELYGEVCVPVAGCGEGTANVDLLDFTPLLGFDTASTKPISMFGIDVPGLQFDKEYVIHVPTQTNPTGINVDSTPGVHPTPIVGQVTFHNLEDKSGGTLNGDSLELTTNQNVFEAEMSLTGVLEAVNGSPGMLRQEISLISLPVLPDIKVQYTIADVLMGPVFGMQQSFSLDPHLSVELEFDQPVIRKEQVFTGEYRQGECIVRGVFNTCLLHSLVPVFEWQDVLYEDGIVSAGLGEQLELMFAGELGQLVNRSYFLDDPMLSNTTSMTIDPALQIKLFCAKFTAIEEKCLFDEQFQFDIFSDIALYDDSWIMGGFDEISFNGVYSWGSDGVMPPGDDVAEVPIPPTYLMLLVGGIALRYSLNVRGLFRRNERV